MAAQNKNIDNHSVRTSEKQLWQEYLTMPNIRISGYPDCKNYTVPLKEAGKGRPLEQMWEEYRAKKTVGKKKIIDVENYFMAKAKENFVNSTTLKSQMTRVNHHVKLGLQKAERELDIKRNKLKGMILKEETELTNEYVERAQKFTDEMLEKKKKRVEEIMAIQEREKEEQTRLLLEQQIRESSESYREHFSKRTRIEIAEDQKQQICEKIMQKEREEQFEKFWLELSKKQDEERKKYEEEEEEIRLTKVREQREILNKQLLGKKIMEDEMKKIKEAENVLIDQLRERIKMEEEKEKEYKIQRKLELKKIKLSELEESRKQKEEKARKEKAFDDYYCKKVAESIENERKNTRDMRADLKREADYFKQQLKELNLAKIEEEKQIEALRQQEIAKKEAIIERNQEIMREAREKLHRETLETWKQQVIQKRQALETEKQIEKLGDQWSRMMLDKNIELDKMYDESRTGGEVKNLKDLDSQIDYLNVLKNREVQENYDFSKQQQKEQHFQDTNWEKFAESCPSSQMHPFTKVLYKT